VQSCNLALHFLAQGVPRFALLAFFCIAACRFIWARSTVLPETARWPAW
jgi:hypothetical protein